MCHHRRIVPVLVILILFVSLALSALPATAQPARAAEPATSSQRWIELWQDFIALFTVLTEDGRGIWDPNGGGSADAVAPSVDNTADGRGIWDPNGIPSS
jgi:hypothetical protein